MNTNTNMFQMYQNSGYNNTRNHKRTLVLDIKDNSSEDNPLGAAGTFQIDLFEPLIIDKKSEIYLDNFITFNSNLANTEDNCAFCLKINEFNIQSNVASNAKDNSGNPQPQAGNIFNSIVIPNEKRSITSFFSTVSHKAKKYNYICDINPCTLHSLSGKLTNLNGDPIFHGTSANNHETFLLTGIANSAGEWSQYNNAKRFETELRIIPPHTKIIIKNNGSESITCSTLTTVLPNSDSIYFVIDNPSGTDSANLMTLLNQITGNDGSAATDVHIDARPGGGVGGAVNGQGDTGSVRLTNGGGTELTILSATDTNPIILTVSSGEGNTYTDGTAIRISGMGDGVGTMGNYLNYANNESTVFYTKRASDNTITLFTDASLLPGANTQGFGLTGSTSGIAVADYTVDTTYPTTSTRILSNGSTVVGGSGFTIKILTVDSNVIKTFEISSYGSGYLPRDVITIGGTDRFTVDRVVSADDPSGSSDLNFQVSIDPGAQNFSGNARFISEFAIISKE